ncbi:MAG TPA: glutamine-hydrolyzing GMP synthase, partial [Clostridia bacterium]|nr:glutamine-hydrolyzing GMP synthase [Clostridia bacterium]
MRHLHDTILIIDLGGGLARVVVHKIREENVYCEVLSPSRFMKSDDLITETVRGLVVAEGMSVTDAKQGDLEQEQSYQAMRERLLLTDLPILAIGTTAMQLIAQNNPVDIPDSKEQGEDIPFAVRATDKEGIEFGLFDPQTTVRKFLSEICGCADDWTVDAYIREAIEQIRDVAGDHKVVCGLSGGVDSSVAAMLIYRAIGDQLTCIFVDHGFMRKGEPDMVRQMFAHEYKIPLISVDAADSFIAKLEGVLEPETKRKIIGEEFIRIFEDEAKKLNAPFLVQGTIYPDVIESGEDGEVVKSHHNVGGLPDHILFQGIIEPLRVLFKEEVRAVGRALGLPASMVERQPFPGPGLAIRCLGGITREKLDILREADAIFREEIEAQGLRHQVSQYFAVMTGLQSVGVTDGIRTYDYTIALRAIKTDDFMVAQPVEFAWSFLRHVTSRITTEVPHVSRVV